MTAKRHHYVFQAYLKGFSTSHENSEKFVWVYDKEFADGKAPKKPKSVTSICYEDFYYAQEDNEGNLIPDMLEKAFSKIEGIVSPIIKKLNTEQSQLVEITEEERGQLAFLLGISFTRIPSFREASELLFKKKIEYMVKYHLPDIMSPEGKEASEFIEKYGFEVEVKKYASLRPMILYAQTMGNSVLKKSWQFYQAHPDWNFITSDHPVFFDYSEKTYGRDPTVEYLGPLHPLSELVFPLRKDLALVCTPGTYGHKQVFQAKSSEVKKINKSMVKAARKYIVADRQSEALAKLVQKNKDTEQTITID